MNTNFLKNFNFSIYGESHGKSIGAIIDDIPANLEIDIQKIENKLANRNPNKNYNTKRKDVAKINFESGIKNGVTTGTPLVFSLINNDINSENYFKNEFRLNHADYTSFLKYGENYPYAGGGPFSGRLTAIIVVIGEIVQQVIENNYTEYAKYKIFSQIKQIGNLKASSLKNLSYQELENISKSYILNTDLEKEMELYLEKLKKENNSIGGKLEFRISNPPPGLGNIYFESFESILTHALFSIPGLKGVIFGAGEDYYLKTGQEMQEKFIIADEIIQMETNIAGGINGGITNGLQDIIFECIVKAPTAVGKEQDLLVLNSNMEYEKVSKKIVGRHDNFIGNKVIPVVEAWINIVIYNFILENNKYKSR